MMLCKTLSFENVLSYRNVETRSSSRVTLTTVPCEILIWVGGSIQRCKRVILITAPCKLLSCGGSSTGST